GVFASPALTAVLVIGLGAIQIVVHMVFFLHMNTRSEEKFRRLVQGVSDYAIYMLDPTGNVSSWNFGAERIKGYRPQEIIGTHF
ncbi:PAS domain S-box protein, partial [Rhizobium johnstonii]|uniref:PAS domain S-box protein n=1 Tax=Rhizobium johnstonii TaxID=3019933 RepID=UPI003F9D0C87